MRGRVFVLSAIILAACAAQANHPTASGTPGSSQSPSASVSATSSTPLFVVLETRRAGARESEYAGAHDTIAIAGFDGFAKAKVTFTPRSIPQIPMAGPVLQPEAYMAAQAVYFIDGTGVVRRLDVTGAVRKVTTFPIKSPQQAVSFVVSPDGKHLMATVLTYPDVVPNPSNNGPPATTSGPWALDFEKADDGGQATVVKHWQAQTTDYPGTANGFHNLVVVGWDPQGPLAMIDGNNGAQQILADGQRWSGGHLVRLSADGSIGADQGPAGCSVYWLDDRGTLICTTGLPPATIHIARLDGHILWSAPGKDTQPGLPGAYEGLPGGYALSADGQRLAMDGEIASRNGSSIVLPANFQTRGWLDSQTIIGLLTTNSMAVYHLQTSKLEDWGFSGQFVGVLN